MKTNILKIKAVAIALVIASSSASIQAGNQAGNNEQELLAQTTRTAEHEQEFVQSMFLEIKGAVKATADLVERFIDKNDKDTFIAFIGRCQERLDLIQKNILDPLKQELQSAQAGTTYHKILELTFSLAQEMAYKELKTLHTILYAHSKSDKSKSAMALLNALKPHLTKITSVASLDLLDKKLMEIYNLLPSDRHTAVKKELEQLRDMVKDIKTKTDKVKNAINIELLAIISAKLKRS